MRNQIPGENQDHLKDLFRLVKERLSDYLGNLKVKPANYKVGDWDPIYRNVRYLLSLAEDHINGCSREREVKSPYYKSKDFDPVFRGVQYQLLRETLDADTLKKMLSGLLTNIESLLGPESKPNPGSNFLLDLKKEITQLIDKASIVRFIEYSKINGNTIEIYTLELEDELSRVIGNNNTNWCLDKKTYKQKNVLNAHKLNFSIEEIKHLLDEKKPLEVRVSILEEIQGSRLDILSLAKNRKRVSQYSSLNGDTQVGGISGIYSGEQENKSKKLNSNGSESATPSSPNQSDIFESAVRLPLKKRKLKGDVVGVQGPSISR